MFGTIILTAILTTSSATAEDAGEEHPPGSGGIRQYVIGASRNANAASSAVQKAQVKGHGVRFGCGDCQLHSPRRAELSLEAIRTLEAVDMAKGPGTLKEAPEFLYVVTDVNANMAVKCKRVRALNLWL